MKTCLSSVLCLSFMLIHHALSAQDALTFQPDSIYSINQVKLRHWFSGTNKLHVATSHYNRNGQLVRHMKPDNYGFTELNTYYLYDGSGKLNRMVDSIKTRIPTKKEADSLMAMGLIVDSFLTDLRASPRIEVCRYELLHQGGVIVRIAKFNPNETLAYIDSLDNEGKLRRKYSYWNETLVRVDTTSFLFPNLPDKHTGWEYRRGRKREWQSTYRYQFDSQHLLNFVRTRSDGESAKARYFYDEKGLLVKTNSDLFDYEYPLIDVFEYEYYENE